VQERGIILANQIESLIVATEWGLGAYLTHAMLAFKTSDYEDCIWYLDKAAEQDIEALVAQTKEPTITTDDLEVDWGLSLTRKAFFVALERLSRGEGKGELSVMRSVAKFFHEQQQRNWLHANRGKRGTEYCVRSQRQSEIDRRADQQARPRAYGSGDRVER